MLTYSGKDIDPSNVKPSDISSLDIAVSLSRINRFVGHTAYPYSDAQHSLLVCSLVVVGNQFTIPVKWDGHPATQTLVVTKENVNKLQAYGLLHDAHEFLTNDIPTPVKDLLKPRIKEVEDHIQNAIWAYFKLEAPNEIEKAYIKSLDNMAYDIENRNLRDIEFKRLEHPFLGPLMGPMDPNLVALTFLRKLSQLGVSNVSGI